MYKRLNLILLLVAKMSTNVGILLTEQDKFLSQQVEHDFLLITSGPDKGAILLCDMYNTCACSA